MSAALGKNGYQLLWRQGRWKLSLTGQENWELENTTDYNQAGVCNIFIMMTCFCNYCKLITCIVIIHTVNILKGSFLKQYMSYVDTLSSYISLAINENKIH